ncbi:MAG: phosphotransferase, partial [Rhizobiaceae bacterium]|nr:phosphotransferase [Rhizobiaceae bacterium]
MTTKIAGQFDIDAVTKWLSEHLEDFKGPVEVDKYPNGQSNPTFRLITPEHGYVLRRKPSGVLLKSAHAVDREFRVQKALADTAVPVAKIHALCEDDSIIGSSFYIMDEVNGRSFDDPRLPEVPKEERKAIIGEMNRVLA